MNRYTLFSQCERNEIAPEAFVPGYLYSMRGSSDIKRRFDFANSFRLVNDDEKHPLYFEDIMILGEMIAELKYPLDPWYLHIGPTFSKQINFDTLNGGYDNTQYGGSTPTHPSVSVQDARTHAPWPEDIVRHKLIKPFDEAVLHLNWLGLCEEDGKEEYDYLFDPDKFISPMIGGTPAQYKRRWSASSAEEYLTKYSESLTYYRNNIATIHNILANAFWNRVEPYWRAIVEDEDYRLVRQFLVEIYSFLTSTEFCFHAGVDADHFDPFTASCGDSYNIVASYTNSYGDSWTETNSESETGWFSIAPYSLVPFAAGLKSHLYGGCSSEEGEIHWTKNDTRAERDVVVDMLAGPFTNVSAYILGTLTKRTNITTRYSPSFQTIYENNTTLGEMALTISSIYDREGVRMSTGKVGIPCRVTRAELAGSSLPSCPSVTPPTSGERNDSYTFDNIIGHYPSDIVKFRLSI